MKKIAKIGKVLLWILLVLVLIAAAYAAYLFLSYHRIGNETLAPVNAVSAEKEIAAGRELTITSWNIGFGRRTGCRAAKRKCGIRTQSRPRRGN